MALTTEDLSKITTVVKDVVQDVVKDAVRAETAGFATKEDLEKFATKQEMREIVHEIVHEEVGALSRQVSSFVEDNFTPAIDSLQEQIGDIKSGMKRMRVVVD